MFYEIFLYPLCLPKFAISENNNRRELGNNYFTGKFIRGKMPRRQGMMPEQFGLMKGKNPANSERPEQVWAQRKANLSVVSYELCFACSCWAYT